MIRRDDIQRGASAEAARGALRAVRVATHPDRNRGSAATEAAATEAAKWVARAAEVLTDPERRGAYVDAAHSLAAYTTSWGGYEFREILFESCYAVHFSLSRNFVRKLICWPFPFSRNFVRKLIAGPPVREGHRTGP